MPPRGTLVEIKFKQLERSGKKLSEEEKKELYDSVKRTYDEQTDPRYGAARLWIDRIIDPDRDSGRDHAGAGSRRAESRCGGVQGGSAADRNISLGKHRFRTLDERVISKSCTMSRLPVKLIECPRDAWQGLQGTDSHRPESRLSEAADQRGIQAYRRGLLRFAESGAADGRLGRSTEGT